jgi:hypothetical protein
MGNTIRDHLVGLDSERHKYGRHFYAQASRSITVTTVPQGAAVSITQLGFRQRLYGGPIDPKTGMYLTIPASPDAYGKRAGEFPDLHFAYVMDPETNALRPALVRNQSTPISIRRRKKEDGSVNFHVTPGQLQGGEVMYWLVRHVDQDADPSVLPENSEMTASAVAAMDARFRRLSDRAAQGDS